MTAAAYLDVDTWISESLGDKRLRDCRDAGLSCVDEVKYSARQKEPSVLVTPGEKKEALIKNTI